MHMRQTTGMLKHQFFLIPFQLLYFLPCLKELTLQVIGQPQQLWWQPTLKYSVNPE